MGFKYFYPRVLTTQEYSLTQVLTNQEYSLTQVFTIQEYSLTQVLTNQEYSLTQVLTNQEYSLTQVLTTRSTHQPRYLLIIDKIYCCSTRVYKKHLKTVKGCRIDTGLCKKALSKASSKNA